MTKIYRTELIFTCRGQVVLCWFRWLDDRRSHHPATRIMFLYWHMTGEVIIQLPGYCLCTNIWQEKSPSSYPDNVSMQSYDRRSHHPDNVSMQSYDRRSCTPCIFTLLILYRNIIITKIPEWHTIINI